MTLRGNARSTKETQTICIESETSFDNSKLFFRDLFSSLHCNLSEPGQVLELKRLGNEQDCLIKEPVQLMCCESSITYFDCCKIDLEKRRNKLEQVKNRISLLQLHARKLIDRAHQDFFLYQQDLQRQYITASRRLQFLLYDCIGELDKVLLNIKLSSLELNLEIKTLIEETKESFYWERFLYRLMHDSCGGLILTSVPKRRLNKEGKLLQNTRNELFDIISCELLNLLKNAEAIKDSQIVIKKITEIRFKDQEKHSSSLSGKAHNNLEMISNLKDFAKKLLIHFSKRDKNNQMENNFPSFPLTFPLNSNVYRWLTHPRNPEKMLSETVDGRVYYCIEEVLANSQDMFSTEALANRLAATLDEDEEDIDVSHLQAFMITQFLGGIYCKPESTASALDILKQPQKILLKVRSAKTRHRSSILHSSSPQLSNSSSDVLLVEATLIDSSEEAIELHFASASISQLAQSKEFMYLKSKLSSGFQETLKKRFFLENTHPEGIITHLYHAFVDESAPKTLETMQNPIIHSVLSPLSREEMHDLIALYVLRDLPNHEDRSIYSSRPDAFTVIPESGSSSRTYYCTVQNPSLYFQSNTKKIMKKRSQDIDKLITKQQQKLSKDYGKDAHLPVNSLLVQFEIKKNVENTNECHALKRLCNWRACYSEEQNSSMLCSHHSSLKAFLDNNLESAEANRYLPPRKSTRNKSKSSQNKGSFTKSGEKASYLIQEFLSGKLATAITAFCNRSIKDSTKRVEIVETENQNLVNQLDNNKQLLDALQRLYIVEERVTQLLQMLLTQGYYPAKEFAELRKQHQAMQAHEKNISCLNDTLQELHFADKKLKILDEALASRLTQARY